MRTSTGNMNTSGGGESDPALHLRPALTPLRRTIKRDPPEYISQHQPRRLNRLGAGRPRMIGHEYIQKFFYACSELGAGVPQLAKLFGVPQQTIYNAMRADQDIRYAIRHGQDVYCSQKVEASLLKRATGYDYVERTEEDVQISGRTADGMRVYVPAHKTTEHHRHSPPDVGAMVFYLTNRAPQRWANTQRRENVDSKFIEQSVTVDFGKLSKDEIEAYRNILDKALSDRDADGAGQGQPVPSLQQPA